MTSIEHWDAIETLGELVSDAGVEGDEALDVFKDAVAEGKRLRELGDEMAKTARDVLHGRAHSGALLVAINAWQSARGSDTAP